MKCIRLLFGLLFILIALTIPGEIHLIASEKKVIIGFTVPNETLFNYIPTLIQMAEDDINSYLKANEIDYRFHFVVENCEELEEVALSKTKEFKEKGINIIVGHGRTSLSQYSLKYVNENNMVLLCPGSTSLALSIPKDNLFRLMPNEAVQGRIISKMVNSFGIKSLVVIQLNGTLEDSIYEPLKEEYERLGGKIIHRLLYDMKVKDFSSVLESASSYVELAMKTHVSEKVGIVIVGVIRVANILSQAINYPVLMNIPWFGSEGAVQSIIMNKEALISAQNLGILSLEATIGYNQRSRDLGERLKSETGINLELFEANYYDAYWLYALSVVKAGSEDITAIKEVLPQISENYFGVSGWIKFDENGDRESSNYNIWRVGSDAVEPTLIRVGFYNSTIDEIAWEVETAPGGSSAQKKNETKYVDPTTIESESNPFNIINIYLIITLFGALILSLIFLLRKSLEKTIKSSIMEDLNKF